MIGWKVKHILEHYPVMIIMAMDGSKNMTHHPIGMEQKPNIIFSFSPLEMA